MVFPWVADAHTDFLHNVYRRIVSLQADELTQYQYSLPTLQKGNIGLQIFAAFIDRDLPEHPVVQCLKQFQVFFSMLETWGPCNVINADLDSLACPSAPTRAILSIEGGEACCGSCEILQLYARLGVKAMTLVWNHPNELGYPALGHHYNELGLTEQGFSMIKQMNDSHIAIDVSHLNEKGFWDCIHTSQVPIFASHSNAYALRPHPRNLTDDQIKAIIEQEGYIGLNFNPPFLCESSQGTLSDIIRHARHILDLGGENVLGFGSDFDGVDALPIGMKGVQHFPMLQQAFFDAGIQGHLLDKISHQNLVRYLSQFY